jgi:hypothetical protein
MARLYQEEEQLVKFEGLYTMLQNKNKQLVSENEKLKKDQETMIKEKAKAFAEKKFKNRHDTGDELESPEK